MLRVNISFGFAWNAACAKTCSDGIFFFSPYEPNFHRDFSLSWSRVEITYTLYNSMRPLSQLTLSHRQFDFPFSHWLRARPQLAHSLLRWDKKDTAKKDWIIWQFNPRYYQLHYYYSVERRLFKWRTLIIHHMSSNRRMWAIHIRSFSIETNHKRIDWKHETELVQ